MRDETRTTVLSFCRNLIWTFAVISAHAAFAQAPPQVPGNPFGMNPMIQLDPAAIKARLEGEMEKCRRAEEIVDVHEKVGCKTLDAMLEISLGQHDKGFASFKEAIVALEGAGDRFGAAVIHMLMAEAAKQTNRAAEAVTAYEGSIAALEDLRKSNAPIVLKSFTFFLRLSGFPEGMFEQMGPMMSMMQPMLIDQVEAMIRVSLAAYLMDQERYDDAEPHLLAARPLSSKLFGLMDGPVLGQLGLLREHQGRFEEAREIYEEAIAAAQRSGDEARRLDFVGRLEAIDRESLPEPPPPEVPEEPVPAPPNGKDQAAAPRPPLRLPSGQAGFLDLDVEILEARFLEEVDRCRASRDPPTMAACNLMEGLVKVEDGRLAAGLVDLEASLESLEGVGDRMGMILVRAIQGNAQSQAHHHVEAIGHYKTALAEIEALADWPEPLNLGIFSTFFQFTGIPGVPSPSSPANPTNRATLTALLELTVHDGLGMALAAQDRLDEAEEEIRKAASVAESFYGLMDSQVYDHFGQVVALQGRFEEARRYYLRALDKTGLLGEMSVRLDILRRLTELEMVSGRTAEAQRFSQMALALARRQEDRRSEALVWVDQAAMAFEGGSMAEVRKASKQALEAAGGSDDHMAKALAQVAGAMAAVGTGDYDDALGHFEKASSILNEVDADHPRVTLIKAKLLTMIGSTYGLLGMLEPIAEKAAQARKLAEESGHAEALAWSDFVQEFGQRLEGQPDTLEQGVKSLLGIMNSSDGLAIRNLEGPLMLMTTLPKVPGLEERSVASARERLENQTDSGPPWVQATASAVLALDSFSKGRYSEAVEILGKVVEEVRERQMLDLEVMSTAALAMIHWASGHQREAAQTARRAADLLESIAGSVHVEELLAALFGKSRQRFMQVAVLLTALESQEEEAFELAERARARALLHMLKNQRLDLRTGANQELLTELYVLRSEILALEGNYSAGDALRQKRRAYEESLVKIKLDHPETNDLLGADPLDLATLQKVDLPPETTLVSYFMTPVSLLAWVVDREDLTQVMIPIADDERQELVCLGERLGPGRDRAARSRAGCAGLDGLEEKYYSRLVAPLLPFVRHDRMIVVPHDVLHYVPFAALRDPESGHYLVETKTVSYSPSVSVLRFLAEKASSFDGEVLVMGDPETELPELPGAIDEARTVAELFGAEPRLRADASENLVRASASKVDLLHLAAHGVYRPVSPRFSHVALAAGGGEDGLLEVDEVFSSLDLKGVNLVTLSACQTALGERNDGDDILGLTRAFIYAGSPAIVSTLWQVHDEATAFLMKEFYELLISGAPYAEALRAAQRETLKQPGWSDPYFWAAFTLTGDPEGHWETPGV